MKKKIERFTESLGERSALENEKAKRRGNAADQDSPSFLSPRGYVIGGLSKGSLIETGPVSFLREARSHAKVSKAARPLSLFTV